MTWRSSNRTGWIGVLGSIRWVDKANVVEENKCHDAAQTFERVISRNLFKSYALDKRIYKIM